MVTERFREHRAFGVAERLREAGPESGTESVTESVTHWPAAPWSDNATLTAESTGQ